MRMTTLLFLLPWAWWSSVSSWKPGNGWRLETREWWFPSCRGTTWGRGWTLCLWDNGDGEGEQRKRSIIWGSVRKINFFRMSWLVRLFTRDFKLSERSYAASDFPGAFEPRSIPGQVRKVCYTPGSAPSVCRSCLAGICSGKQRMDRHWSWLLSRRVSSHLVLRWGWYSDSWVTLASGRLAEPPLRELC